MKYECDVIVIGSGIAGLYFANKLAELREDLTIAVLSKNTWNDSNSIHAQGGIAAVMDLKNDSIAAHIDDTLKSGRGLSDPDVVKLVVNEGPKRIQELIDFGVGFTKNIQGNLDLVLEGGHSAKRIVHVNDHSGLDVMNALYNYSTSKRNIELHENQLCIELLKSNEGSIKGVQTLNKFTNQIDFFKVKIVVLATGGCGQVYQYTTNPSGATGDGVCLGIKVGAMISNMNYIQFHPSAIYNEKLCQLDLISESIRGAGAYVINSKGERFLFKYDHRGELATRDIVSKAIFEELKLSQEKSVFLDVRHLPFEEIKLKFPLISRILDKNGIDSQNEIIPIIPAAHYQCGGLKVNERAQTSVTDLYAIGECSETGLHGSNRLASNSLLEALVFGHQASEYIALIIDQVKHEEVIPTDFVISYKNELEFDELSNIIKNAMSKYVTIHSRLDDLHIAEMIIKDCQSYINLIVDFKTKISESFLKASNCLLLAKTIIQFKKIEFF